MCLKIVALALGLRTVDHADCPFEARPDDARGLLRQHAYRNVRSQGTDHCEFIGSNFWESELQIKNEQDRI
jgi:hypothetical protein